MKHIDLTDSFALPPSSREITPEGYLKATAALTSVGVQDYVLSDFTGLEGDKTKIVKVLRPEKTVFDALTMSSAQLKPITMYHPEVLVDSDNHHNYAVGNIGEKVYKLDDKRLGATIVVTNKDIVDSIDKGKINQVSVGYTADVKKSSGTFDGEAYDYVFDGAMHINHCAIVPKGRCGEGVAILDKGIDTETNVHSEKIQSTIKQMLLQDFDVKNTLKSLLQELVSKKTQSQDNSNNQKENEENKVITNDNDTQKINDQAVEARVNFRVNLLDKARHFFDDQGKKDLLTLTDRQILEKIFEGHENIKHRSDDYLLGMMDAHLDDNLSAKIQHKSLQREIRNNNPGTAAKFYSLAEIRKLVKE